ncbi:MAG: chloride channel protein [Myxococcota bacterium]
MSPTTTDALKRRASAPPLLQWVWVGALVGVVCGAASAIFLELLDFATKTRVASELWVWCLPFAGAAIGFIYDHWGKPIRGGNNLVIDTVHDDRPQIPLRMAPMVLVGTVLTHLFGGSAGREGTAVQMGASLADAVAHFFRLTPHVRRQMLAAGIAGGFGSVFGTPVAGAVFGLEVVCIGRLEYDALLPALIAAVVGDLTTRALGVTHTAYPVPAALPLDAMVLAKWLVFGAGIALATVLFVELTHGLKARLERWVPRLPVRMFLGGCLVVLMWRLVGSGDYLGLGVPTIVAAFTEPDIPAYAFLAKIVFTAVTLSAGFLGGEVTPLFFVGATLGNILGQALGLPLELAAGVGLAALFGAAANTPLALSIMAVELLGGNAFPHVVIVVTAAYVMTGHRGIYPAQRLLRGKWGGPPLQPAVALRDVSQRPPPGEDPPSPQRAKVDTSQDG